VYQSADCSIDKKQVSSLRTKQYRGTIMNIIQKKRDNCRSTAADTIIIESNKIVSKEDVYKFENVNREEPMIDKVQRNETKAEMPKSNKPLGHAAVFGAYLIFAVNIIVCKDLSNSGIISPLGLFCFRAVGATLLFWIASLFLPSQKVETKDLVSIFIASMLGIFLTQLTFLKAITITTPLDASLINSVTPIFTMFIAAIVLKEPITLKKAGGVALSFAGIIMLIINTVSIKGGVTNTQPLGIVLILLNSLCFAFYLGVFRPLISKYSAVTFMKWMFLFSTIVAVPLDIKELTTLNYSLIPADYRWKLAFVVVFSTFIAYFLIPVGQKILRPTVVSMYSYTQPIVASAASIWIGMDILNWQKIIAAISVFAGLYLVNKSRAAGEQKRVSRKYSSQL
jgi:drug/metabolite transporter (DMT)-like permease